MIRKATALDIDKIMNITRACANNMIAQNIKQWNEQYPNREAFEQDVNRGELYVLIDNTLKLPINQAERLIGCITISTLKDSEYNDINWLTKDDQNIYIHRLAVHPDFQKKGYAKRLMDFAEEFAKQQKAHSVRLDTFSLNTRNQKFYKNRGYIKLGNIYFPKQSDAPFYCYELPLATV